MLSDVFEALIKNAHWESCTEALKWKADCNVV
jgi:hypothetical protein